MFSLSFRRTLAAVVAIALLPSLAACDDGAIPSNPDDLLADARIARQSGDLDLAISLLETALERDGTDALVRIELSSALLERADLGIFELDRLATYLSDDAGTQDASPPTASQSGTCEYADLPGATPFDPRDLEEYTEILEGITVAQRVRDLLDPVITQELRPDDFICTGIVDGDLNYDEEAALTALQSVDPDITDPQIAAALAVNAVAEATLTYTFLADELADRTEWYRLPDGGLGICPVNISEEELYVLTEPQVANLGEALLSIDLRSQILGESDASTELVSIVIDTYEEISEDLAPFCPGS